MLSDTVKKSIQSAYTELLEKYGFTPRHGQRQMIAEIANSLATIDPSLPEDNDEGQKPPVCVVEAGTGTGKTLAYILAVLPVAKALDRKVVLSTATVALQEQIMLKDLPDILTGCSLAFSYAMAKGRGRYVCLSRLDTLLQNNDSLDALYDLYGEQQSSPLEHDRRLYQHMLDEISAGKWQGDRDEWHEPIADSSWKPVTVDNSQCLGSRCANFRQCFFFRARESLDKVDCIVANHDLVLSDLALGGGVILPDPGDTVYIFDEAHHLSFKSNHHFSAFTRIKGSIGWLQQCEKTIARISNETMLAKELASVVDLVATSEAINGTADKLNEAWLILDQTLSSVDSLDSYGNTQQYTFRLGVIPDELRQLAEQLENQHSRLYDRFFELQEYFKKLVENSTEMSLRVLSEQWFPVLGSMVARAESSLKLWTSFAHKDAETLAPFARWLTINNFNEVSDISLASSPVLAAANLEQKLWDECSAAVLTSATLSALGNFDNLTMRAGLPAHAKFLAIPSPFDFQNNAVLSIPKIGCDPSDNERHTAVIIRSLPQLIGDLDAALMLFSSRKQMQDVMQGLPDSWQERILCQDDYQKAQILKLHRLKIDKGEGSVIFGLASFAEGVDLPGKYCNHVLIAKIPFAVPNDPIESTLSQWIESRGDNAFMTLAVPEAAFRLVQACGRLLRNETDQGRITIFDERLVTKFYGKAILKSLPSYRREIFEQKFE